MVKVSPLRVTPLLPGTNCGECGEETCMAFAVKLLDHVYEIADCKPLMKEKKYAKKLKKLKDLITAPIRPIKVGVGDRAITIGGEEVLYRHELTFYSPSAIILAAPDNNEAVLEERAKFVKDWNVYRIGETLTLQGLAIRAVSNDPATFAKAVKKTLAIANIPLVLCSTNPAVLKAGAQAAKGKNPLLYAATKDNWQQIAQIAMQNDCGVVAFSTDLNELVSLATSMAGAGLEKIAVDPGLMPTDGHLADSLDRFMMLRKAAIRKDNKSAGWPIISVLATAYIGKSSGMSEAERIETAFCEGELGITFIGRSTNMVIVQTADSWLLLGLMVLRQAVYSDPRVHPSVDAKLYELGTPDENSPVFVTTNYTMTYFAVKDDLEALKLNGWLLLVDSEGICVESAVAGGQIKAEHVAEAIKESGLENKVKHKVVIIPGLAARLSGELEGLANWKVLVGPRDSGDIGPFMETKWDGKLEQLMKEWQEMQD
ncbi:MAG: acetyl-CoA decarbonylase/synthase complex subunit gamma [Candidatus Helarchaeota archaeon]|nr:acetyl-CoA decarbonylase/synthase complex subunit gamma [Candidatus Helarchaeota archaeon]